MFIAKEFPDWQHQACWLNKGSIDQPHEVIRRFFETYSLPLCRKTLWEMLVGFMNSELADDLSRNDRSDVLFFFQGMIEVLEAGNLISISHNPD